MDDSHSPVGCPPQRRRWSWAVLGLSVGVAAPIAYERATDDQPDAVTADEAIVAVSWDTDFYRSYSMVDGRPVSVLEGPVTVEINYPDGLPSSSHSVAAVLFDQEGGFESPSLVTEPEIKGSIDASVTFDADCNQGKVQLLVVDSVGNYPLVNVTIIPECG